MYFSKKLVIQLMIKIFFIFPCICGVTFNGLSINNNFEIKQSNVIKYYGHICLLFNVLSNIIFLNISIKEYQYTPDTYNNIYTYTSLDTIDYTNKCTFL